MKNNKILKKLELKSVDGINNSFLEDLPKHLSNLSIENVKIENFDFLKKFTLLRELKLQSTGFKLQKFESLSKLRLLALDEIGKKEDYSIFRD